MPEPESLDELQHIQREALKTIELEARSLTTDQEAPPAGMTEVVGDVREMLNGVVEQISVLSSRDPELLFQHAIGSLSVLDARRFVIENLLEALKRGEDLHKAIHRFKSLGMVGGEPGDQPTILATPDDARRASSLLQRLRGACARGATSLVDLGAAALRRVPKWAEIEPQVQVLPFPALSFGLKGKSMDNHDLLEAILLTLRRMEAQQTRTP